MRARTWIDRDLGGTSGWSSRAAYSGTIHWALSTRSRGLVSKPSLWFCSGIITTHSGNIDKPLCKGMTFSSFELCSAGGWEWIKDFQVCWRIDVVWKLGTLKSGQSSFSLLKLPFRGTPWYTPFSETPIVLFGYVWIAFSKIASIPFGNQTWLAGKYPI